ncbi:MAG: hypothetical protein JWM80_2718 [Cyanobacteria bacterium RYN_339]|nr:hypothetical protein [Cyanobacteria bacterium RYN_339]
MRPVSALLLAIAGSLLASPALAADPAPVYPKFTPASLIFADYRGAFSGPQSFNVTRAYLTLRGELDPTWSSVVTLNAAPLAYLGSVGATTPAREAHEEVLQLAYLQAANWVPHTTLQLGLITTPWVEYEYAYWRYRMLGTVGVEGGMGNTLGLAGATGYLPLWDHGLKATYSLGPVTIAGAVLNGEGFRAGEGDGQKSFQGRIAYQPWPFLDLAVTGHRGNPSTAQQADRVGAMVTYHAAPLNAGAEAIMTTDVSNAGANVGGRVLSGWGVYELATPWLPVQLIGRVNRIEANVDVPTANRLEVLAGIGCQPIKGVDLVLDDQNVTGSTATAAVDSNTLALHTAFAF